jgi:hypothetical protein
MDLTYEDRMEPTTIQLFTVWLLNINEPKIPSDYYYAFSNTIYFSDTHEDDHKSYNEFTRSIMPGIIELSPYINSIRISNEVPFFVIKFNKTDADISPLSIIVRFHNKHDRWMIEINRYSGDAFEANCAINLLLYRMSENTNVYNIKDDIYTKLNFEKIPKFPPKLPELPQYLL